MTDSKHSPGAIRAGKELDNYLCDGGSSIAEFVKIIDRGTGCKELREALEFYENKEHYKWRDTPATAAGILLPNPNKPPLVVEDEGQIARTALANKENEDDK